MKPDSPRYRLVEGLRLAAIRAERFGSRVEVVDCMEPGKARTLISVAPRQARVIADELERRWSS